VDDISERPKKHAKGGPRLVSPEGLLCALVLAPDTFARNRFFGLFEQPECKWLCCRAARIRGIIRQL